MPDLKWFNNLRVFNWSSARDDEKTAQKQKLRERVAEIPTDNIYAVTNTRVLNDHGEYVNIAVEGNVTKEQAESILLIDPSWDTDKKKTNGRFFLRLTHSDKGTGDDVLFTAVKVARIKLNLN